MFRLVLLLMSGLYLASCSENEDSETKDLNVYGNKELNTSDVSSDIPEVVFYYSNDGDLRPGSKDSQNREKLLGIFKSMNHPAAVEWINRIEADTKMAPVATSNAIGQLKHVLCNNKSNTKTSLFIVSNHDVNQGKIRFCRAGKPMVEIKGDFRAELAKVVPNFNSDFTYDTYPLSSIQSLEWAVNKLKSADAFPSNQYTYNLILPTHAGEDYVATPFILPVIEDIKSIDQFKTAVVADFQSRAPENNATEISSSDLEALTSDIDSERTKGDRTKGDRTKGDRTKGDRTKGDRGLFSPHFNTVYKTLRPVVGIKKVDFLAFLAKNTDIQWKTLFLEGCNTDLTTHTGFFQPGSLLKAKVHRAYCSDAGGLNWVTVQDYSSIVGDQSSLSGTDYSDFLIEHLDNLSNK